MVSENAISIYVYMFKEGQGKDKWGGAIDGGGRKKDGEGGGRSDKIATFFAWPSCGNLASFYFICIFVYIYIYIFAFFIYF